MVVLFTPLRIQSHGRKPEIVLGRFGASNWSWNRQRNLALAGRKRGKTRQGLEGSHQRQFNPKIFATRTEQCPVRYFKIFESHRPEEAKTPTSPFFLAINHNAWCTKSTWYKVSPLGKNQIGQFLPKAAKKAGLQILPPNSSVHEPVFPVNQSSSSFQCSVSNQSRFSVQAMPHHSFFASATIGSISNCVFNIVHPRDTASSCKENFSQCIFWVFPFTVFTFDICCRKHAF